MLAYVLAAVIALCSVALYMAAFLFPQVHRRDDFVWSGLGLFYALMLWVCAGQIRGAVLLGQMASTGLILWFIWETITLRQLLFLKEEGVVTTPELEAQLKKFSPIKFFQSLTGKKAPAIAVKPNANTPVEPEPKDQPTTVEEEVNKTAAASEPSAPHGTAVPPQGAKDQSPQGNVASQEEVAPPPQVEPSKSEEVEPTTAPVTSDPEDDGLDGLVEVLEESLEETADFVPEPVKRNPLKGLLDKVTGLFIKKSPTNAVTTIEEEDDDFDFEEEVPPPVAEEDQLPPGDQRDGEEIEALMDAVVPSSTNKVDLTGGQESEDLAETTGEVNAAAIADQTTLEVPTDKTKDEDLNTTPEQTETVESPENSLPEVVAPPEDKVETPVEKIELSSTDEINAAIANPPTAEPATADPSPEVMEATIEADAIVEAEDQDSPENDASMEEQVTTEVVDTEPDPAIKKVNSPYDTFS